MSVSATSAARRRVRVFINCPFDKKYEPLFLALVSGVVCVGLEPHCVLEVPSAQKRLDRIQKLISSCGASIHDLSRVTLSGKSGERVPRFNMPFELGLACQEAFHTNGRHSFFIFEETPYRIIRSLSDLNGYDPLIHGGEPSNILRCVVNALGSPSGSRRPTMRVMEEVYAGVVRVIRLQRRQGELGTVFDRGGFQLAVLAATELARDSGLVA